MANILRSWQGKLVVGLKNNVKDVKGSPLWIYDGKWKEIPTPQGLRNIYSATVDKDKIYFGTQSNITSIDDQVAHVYEYSANGDWVLVDSIGVKFIESLCTAPNGIFYSIGWEHYGRSKSGHPSFPFIFPAYFYDGEVKKAGIQFPSEWILNNNFNSSICSKDGVFLTSGGWLGNTSVWYLPSNSEQWFLVGSKQNSDFPNLPDVIGSTFQWIYRATTYKNGFIFSMAGHEGAAQVWYWEPSKD